MAGYRSSFATLASLFFMWGFITVMNDILINTFQGIFEITPIQRSLVQFAFFGAFFIVSLLYFIISSSSGKDPINRIGYNNGMVISLIVCGIGCTLFYPAAILNSYEAFLGSLFILASGVTLLQICANPYAAILGRVETASSRLNLAQGLNSLGTTIGPLVGVILIYKIFSDGEQTAYSVGKTYMIYGICFFILAILTKLAKMPSFKNTEHVVSGLGVLKFRHLSLGILAIFFYVGSEVAVGSWLVEFLKSDQIVGMAEDEASYFLSWFWGGLMIGRLMASISLNDQVSQTRKMINMLIISLAVFTFIYIATALKIDQGDFHFEFMPLSSVLLFLLYMFINYLAFLLGKGRPARSLVIFSSINAILLIIAITQEGSLAFWSLLGTGLFFSIGWSNIFTLAIKDLGVHTSQGSSLLVMAIVGGAALPAIQSAIIQYNNVQISFIIPLIGMIYLIFYGINGYKQKT